MNTPLPFGEVRLVGRAVMRGVTLVLPTQTVLSILPHGMRLRDQQLTPPGTHPVILFCYDIFRAHMTVPTLLPNLSYFEHVVGIPFVEISPDVTHPVPGGPFFFMPQLLLTSELAMLGGRLWWGFAKNLARIVVTADRYEVWSLDGRPLVGVEFHPTTNWQPVSAYPHFDMIRPAVDQPLVTQVPLGLGPFVVGSRFERDWSTAQMRGISTAVHVVEQYVPGLPAGRYPSVGFAPGIEQSPLGSYEFTTWWSQSLVYPTWWV